MAEEQEQQEKRRKNLIAMLSDVKVDGLNIPIMVLQELEDLETLHKAYNIEFNRQNPRPPTANPDVGYVEKRQFYVNKKISDIYSTKQNLIQS